MSATMGNNELTLALRLEGTTGAASVEVERLVDVAAMVATLPDPEIDPVFAAKLEQRLLTEGLAEKAAETPEPYQGLRVVRTPQPEIVPAREEKVAPNVITLPSRRYVMRKALVAAIAAALAMAMPLAMASTALPGTLGYGIKEARRAIQLHFAGGSNAMFTMEHQAREYLEEASQLVAMGASSDLIRATLAKAYRLQRMAALEAIRSGSAREIARLRGMLERDGDTLRTLLKMSEESHPVVISAINQVEDLSAKLALAMGVVLDETSSPAQKMEAIAATIEAPAAEQKQATNGSSEANGSDGQTPAAPKPPKVKDAPPKTATPGHCGTIGQAWFGNTLQTPSEVLCAGSNNHSR